NPFEAPPSTATVIEYVNTLGYPSTLRNVSALSINALYQPWRAILSMINMCLTCKTVGFDRPRHPVLQILWEHDKAKEEDVTESPKAAKATKSKTAKQTKPSAPKASKVTTPPKPTPTTTEPSKKDQISKVIKQRKPKSPLLLVDEFVDECVPEQEPVYGDEEADIQRTPKKKSPTEQYIFQRCTPTTTEPSGYAESPFLYAELGLTNSETEFDEEVSPEINVGTQDEGQDGPNPESQPQSSHDVHAGPNLEHMDFEVTNASTQQNPKQMDEEFTTTAYLSVQENLKLTTEDQEDEPDKSNIEVEVQSMVMVPIHQDTSLVPLMATLVIDLTMSQPVSTTVQAPLPTSTITVITITTTISLPPPPPQPQQSTADPILERLDKHGTRLYNLEKLDIPHKVSQAVDEIVTDAVDWANNVHNDLYEALQKSLELDYSNQRLAEQEEARKKRQKRCDAPRSPPGSPPSQPPPPAGASGALGTSGASRYESIGIARAQELSPSDDLMHDDFAPDKQNPLPEEERPVTPEPTWTILSSNVSDVENNWASALALSYEPPAENSLLTKTGDMTTFLNWSCHYSNRILLQQRSGISEI
ncbi:hypothetical protein Tco_0886069, partial [Tanacetum coccineum]